FHIVAYGRRFAGRITSEKEARDALNASRAVFMVYGRARLRTTSDGPKHLLNVRGIVRHSVTSDENKALLSTEFGRFLPQKLILDKTNDVFSFEVTSEWLNVAVRYIVGVASMISGDLRHAETLFLSVRELLPSRIKGIGPVQQLSRTLPGRLANLYSIWMDAVVTKYLATRDLETVEDGELIADKLLATSH